MSSCFSKSDSEPSVQSVHSHSDSTESNPLLDEDDDDIDEDIDAEDTTTTSLIELKRKGKEKVNNDKVEFFPKSKKRGRTSKVKRALRERSDVWAHFKKISVPWIEDVDGVPTVVGSIQKGKCRHCGVLIKAESKGNGTSTMGKHIRDHCKKFSSKFNMKAQQVLTNDVLQNNTLKSVQWSEDACLDAACVMVVLDELPFSSIEKPGFIHFCSVAVPNWKVPCRKTLVMNFLKMYSAKKEELKKEMRGKSVCLTTDTWTSVQNINYMVITTHFIDDEWTLHRRVLNFMVVPNHNGSTIGRMLETCLVSWNLDKCLTVTLDNASANKVVVDYLIRQLNLWPKPPLLNGKFMHVRCLAHIVNLIVKSGLQELEKSVSAIRNAVKYVRSSPQRLEVFKRCVVEAKVPCKNIPVLDVPTRWNSSYLMLATAVELRKAFHRMAYEEDTKYTDYFDENEYDVDELEETEFSGSLCDMSTYSKKKKRDGPPMDSDWDKAAMFVKFLKVFHDVTLTVSTQLAPTAHKAFRDIVRIKAELDRLSKPLNCNTSEVERTLSRMATKMKVKYNKYFGSFNDVNQLFVIALVLDPKFKLRNVDRVCEVFLKMKMEDVENKSKQVRKLLQDLCDAYNSNTEASSSSRKKKKKGLEEVSNRIRIEEESDKEEEEDVLALMDADWDKQLQNEGIVMGGEVDRYLIDPIEKPEGKDKETWDLCQWWKYSGIQYPTLRKIAKDVLVIQVSSVASESSFSTGKRVIDPHRSSLTPKSVEALICFHNWIKSDSIMGLEYTPTIEEMQFFEDVEKEHAEQERIAKEKETASKSTLSTATSRQSKRPPRPNKKHKSTK